MGRRGPNARALSPDRGAVLVEELLLEVVGLVAVFGWEGNAFAGAEVGPR